MANNGDAGFTFGYTDVRADGSQVSTRAIHYLHTSTTDEWEDNDRSGEYLLISGGIMDGVLTLANDPENEYDAATKSYVDNMVFTVVFQPNAVAGLDADSSITEIQTAVNDGKIVLGVLNDNIYRIAYATSTELVFSGVSGTITIDIIYTDGAWTQENTVLLPLSGGANDRRY